MNDEPKITAELRVKSCVVGEHPKPSKSRSAHWGGKTQDVWDVKAEGTWGDIGLPISVYFTTNPGHPVVPRIGETLKITIEA